MYTTHISSCVPCFFSENLQYSADRSCILYTGIASFLCVRSFVCRVRELEGKVRELESSMSRMGAQQDVNMELIDTFRQQKECVSAASFAVILTSWFVHNFAGGMLVRIYHTASVE